MSTISNKYTVDSDIELYIKIPLQSARGTALSAASSSNRPSKGSAGRQYMTEGSLSDDLLS